MLFCYKNGRPSFMCLHVFDAVLDYIKRKMLQGMFGNFSKITECFIGDKYTVNKGVRLYDDLFYGCVRSIHT